MKIAVLDQGFVEQIDSLGNELTVVNAARVSFGRRKAVFDPTDEKLIKYLLTHKHYSPLRHCTLQFHIKAPEFVTRQWYKHVVGAETTSSYATKDHAWNEISGRYRKMESFYCPSSFRAQSLQSKQGSKGDIENQQDALIFWKQAHEVITDCYSELLTLGVSKEQARCILPLSMYTEFYWTASLQAILHFVDLRLDPHAQEEIRVYAEALQTILAQSFPLVLKYWTKK